MHSTPIPTLQNQRSESHTSTYWHLSSPSAITLADSVFWAPCQEVSMLTAVHKRVAEPRQIHSHHVHMERALWLLTSVSWRLESYIVRFNKTQMVRADGWKGSKLKRCMFRTYTLGLCSTPSQIRLAGSRRRSLKQMTWMALKWHHTPHLSTKRDRKAHRWRELRRVVFAQARDRT